jgi:hypothetical protein
LAPAGAAPSATPVRLEPPLVYRAARTSDAAGDAEAPEGMGTWQLSPQTIARVRRGDSPVAPLLIARAEAGAPPSEAAGATATPEGEAAPAPAGPSAAPVTPEADAKKQITLEMLARQVYDRLRARLLIERERSGIGAGMVSR